MVNLGTIDSLAFGTFDQTKKIPKALETFICRTASSAGSQLVFTICEEGSMLSVHHGSSYVCETISYVVITIILG